MEYCRCHLIYSNKLSLGPLSVLCKKYSFVFALSTIVTIALFASACPSNGDAYAQGTHTVLKINVKVTNNGNNDEHGTIHVFKSEGVAISKWLNDVYFPAKQTVTHTFTFLTSDIPPGSSFTTEVVYGDDIFKRVDGKNSPSSIPETVSIVIP